ncbi:hypothetical protein DMA11_05455 [Marinilabiliaceae bacterium JC017]|nr:hypothetical protein DMA11_05455 [Marinilabiliaceae bacterium JC017]
MYNDAYTFSHTPFENQNKFIMSVKFKAIHNSTPGIKGGGQYKYYPRVCNRTKMDLSQLSQRISKMCTAHPADVFLILTALTHEIPDLLLENYSVDLGDLGIFSLHISGEASDTAQEVTAYNIKDVKVAFRPGKRIKQKLLEAKFKRVK